MRDSLLRPREPDSDVAVASAVAEPVVEVTGSPILWEALAGVYESLGFTAVTDEAFPASAGADHRADSELDTIRPVFPPAPRQHRGAPHDRVHRARGRTRSTDMHRPVHQEDHQDVASVADRHDHPRPPADSPCHHASPTTLAARHTWTLGVSPVPV